MPLSPRRLLITAILLVLAPVACAQSRPNALTAELGGAGGVYSVGYERAFAPSVRARAAVSYYGFAGTVPVTALFTPEVGRLGRTTLRAELGGGAVFGATDGPSLYSGGGRFEDGEVDIHVLPTGLLGLRAEVGRVDVRGGVTGLYGVRSAFAGSQRKLFVLPHLGASYRF